MGWLHRIIDRIVAGEGRPEDIDRMYQISAWNDGTTICGMGDAGGYATTGILNKFRDEFEYYIANKRSRFNGNLEALANAEIFINGQSVQAERNQNVLDAALAAASSFRISAGTPSSIAGNCRVCAVQVEGRSWVEIACNMPATEGLRVQTDTELVNEYRKSVLQLLTLNHPVDCGICDKAGECKLQDFHYQYNGSPSISVDPKVRATKFFPLSERIILDNERCILCSRCVRFTHEISRSKALGIKQRGDPSLVRPAEDHF